MTGKTEDIQCSAYFKNADDTHMHTNKDFANGP